MPSSSLISLKGQRFKPSCAAAIKESRTDYKTLASRMDDSFCSRSITGFLFNHRDYELRTVDTSPFTYYLDSIELPVTGGLITSVRDTMRSNESLLSSNSFEQYNMINLSSFFFG